MPRPSVIQGDISQALTAKRALLESDLLSCTIALASYAKHGVPRILREGPFPCPDAPDVLRRVLDAVDPEDLTPEAARVWRLLREGKLIDLPAWCHDGLGIAYMAPTIAVKVNELGDALRRYRANQSYASRALEDAVSVEWS